MVVSETEAKTKIMTTTARNNNLPAMTNFKMQHLGKPRQIIHNSSDDSLMNIADFSPKLRRGLKLENIDVLSKSWDSAGNDDLVKVKHKNKTVF